MITDHGVYVNVEYTDGTIQHYDNTRIIIIEYRYKDDGRFEYAFHTLWLPPPVDKVSVRAIRAFEDFFKAGSVSSGDDRMFRKQDLETNRSMDEFLAESIVDYGGMVFFGIQSVFDFFKYIGYNHRTKRYDEQQGRAQK